VVIAGIVLAKHDLWSYAVALAIFQTLLLQSLQLGKKWEPGRRRVWHVAACSVVVLGLLIVSVYREPTMHSRVFLFLIVSVIQVWSAGECARILCGLQEL
jgi:hypothetical protein